MYKIGKLKDSYINQIQYENSVPVGPVYFFTEGTLDTNYYNDITSIDNWCTKIQRFKDRIFIKDRISEIVDSVGWDNLKITEKRFACQYFAVGATHRNEIYSESEQLKWWNIHIDGMYKSRKDRWHAGKKYIAFYLDKAQSYEVSQETKTFSENYVDYDISEYSVSGVTGLFDWVKGTTALGSTGFPGKSYWTQEIQDKLVDILELGDY